MVARENGKRKQILDAAAVIFSRKGYHQAKVEEIAREAEVGKGTVYEYFNSKKDLFQQVMMEFSNTYFDNFEDKLAGIESVTERLQLILKIHLTFIKDNKEIANILIAEHHLLGEELHHWFLTRQQEKLKKLQSMIQEGIEKGEFKPFDPELAAEMILGLIFSVGGCLLKDPALNIDKIVNTVKNPCTFPWMMKVKMLIILLLVI